MGTALVLLFLLALGAVPGALLPQRSLNETKVDQYIVEHRIIGPWLDRMQFFDVFSSFWFTAIYVLLFVSLVGCLTPRMIEHARSLRATPAPALRKAPQARQRPHVGFAPGNRHRLSPNTQGLAARHAGQRRHDRNLRRKGLPARIRQHRVPLRCSDCWSPSPPRCSLSTRATSSSSPTAGSAFAPRRPPRLTPSAPATSVDGTSLYPMCLRVKDFQARYPPNGQAISSRVEHRLPSRNRPGQWNLEAVPAGGEPPTADRRRPRLPPGTRLRAGHSPSPFWTDRSAPRPSNGVPTMRTPCCHRASSAWTHRAALYPNALERCKHQVAIMGLLRSPPPIRRHPALVQLPCTQGTRPSDRHLPRATLAWTRALASQLFTLDHTLIEAEATRKGQAHQSRNSGRKCGSTTARWSSSTRSLPPDLRMIPPGVGAAVRIDDDGGLGVAGHRRRSAWVRPSRVGPGRYGERRAGVGWPAPITPDGAASRKLTDRLLIQREGLVSVNNR